MQHLHPPRSALRPENLAKPMPTGEGLHPYWRLMHPQYRRSSSPTTRPESPTQSEEGKP